MAKIAAVPVFLVLVILGLCQGYRHGAPRSACNSLTPHHGHHQPQPGNPPYTLEASRNTSTADWVIDMALKGTGQDNLIRGFLVQARVGNTPIGTFTVLDNDHSQLLDCDNDGDSITHTAIDDEVRSIYFRWTAPAHFSDPFRFHYTVALTKHTFWADITKDMEFKGADNLV